MQSVADILTAAKGLTEYKGLMAIQIPYDHKGPDEETPGDYRVSWDTRNDDEVKHAEKTFKKWRKDGYLAYRVSADGRRGDMLTEFDSEAKTIIFTPPMQGGSCLHLPALAT